MSRVIRINKYASIPSLEAIDYNYCNNQSASSRAALPASVENCGDPIVPIGNEPYFWNCSRICNDTQDAPEFAQPYLSGDIIPMFFRMPDFQNANPKTPAFGWEESTTLIYYVKFEVYECGTNNLLHSTVDEVSSDFWVAFEEGYGTFQVVHLDTSLIETCRWYIKVSTWKNVTTTPEEVASVYSEIFQDYSDAACDVCSKPTVLIRSKYKNADCLGKKYIVPTNANGTSTKTPYSNYLRIEGVLEEIPSTIQRTENENGLAISQIFTTILKLETYPAPPYYVNHLINSISGIDLVINQKNTWSGLPTWTVKNEVGLVKSLEIILTKECEIRLVDC